MAVSGRKSLAISSVKSPASAQLGNLTGARRVVNDNVVALHKSIQIWNQLYLDGVNILQTVQNTPDTDSFQDCCEKLGVKVELMIQQTSAMRDCMNKFISLCKLQNNTDLPIFVSWSHQAFGNATFQ